MYLIPPAQAERFPRPYGDETWGSVFSALGVLARASATVRAVIPNSRAEITDLEDACHARYEAATGRAVRSGSDRILAWAIARIDHPEGDLDDAHVFERYDDMVTRRRRPEGQPLVPLVPEVAELRTVLDVGGGMRWAAIEDATQAIAVGHVANCDLANHGDFDGAAVPDGHSFHVLTNVGHPIRSVAVIAFMSTVPGETSSVQGMSRQGEDPHEGHAEAIRALSGHLGVDFPRPVTSPSRSSDDAPARDRRQRLARVVDARSAAGATAPDAAREPRAAPAEWTPLAEPFTAPNGHVVEVISTQAVLDEIGRTFRNALQSPGFRNAVVLGIEQGRIQVYRTLKDGVMQSCGELVVDHGRVLVDNDRALNNGRGTVESKAAVMAFADAVNDGAIEANHEMGESGFVPRQPGCAPTP